MKSKIIVINNIKTVLILFFTIIFIVFLIINSTSENNVDNIENNNTSVNDLSNITNENKTTDAITTSTITNTISQSDVLIEVNGEMVIGKLEIPKINLVTYILPETTEETLNKSVTKLCGPKVNGVGNLCVTGHNYYKDNMFGNLKEIDINDKIYLTDNNGNKIEYGVYEICKVYPEEVECLSQDTKGEREVTLITCTTGAVKRLIVKAVEIYD